MTRKTLPAPSEYKHKAQSFVAVAQAILDGLNGTPISWGVGQWRAYHRMAERMGFTLVAQTGAERKGYRLKPGAKPIGSAAMGSVRYTGRVYILECHFIPPDTTSNHDEVQLRQVASEDTPEDAGSKRGD
jgi:hypothetical protein